MNSGGPGGAGGGAVASPSLVNGGGPDPDFLFQTEEPMNDVEHHAWVSRCLREVRDRGATFFRVSQHDERPNLVLIECWRDEPEDKGAPRFRRKDS